METIGMRVTKRDGELEEINIADLIKGNKYKYNHPLHYYQLHDSLVV